MRAREDIEALAIKLGMLTAGLKDLGDRLTEDAQHATRDMTESARLLASAAEESAREASAQLETNATAVLVAATRAATEDMERALADSSTRLANSSSALEQRMTSLRRLHATSTWKAFLAASVAALVAVVAACSLTWYAIDRVQEANWLDELQRARANGVLRSCPEGGVCAYANKRWHRLSH